MTDAIDLLSQVHGNKTSTQESWQESTPNSLERAFNFDCTLQPLKDTPHHDFYLFLGSYMPTELLPRSLSKQVGMCSEALSIAKGGVRLCTWRWVTQPWINEAALTNSGISPRKNGGKIDWKTNVLHRCTHR